LALFLQGKSNGIFILYLSKDTFILRYIISSSIPDDEIDDSFFMLKEALKVHGKYGFPDKTRLTDFIFEF
jgi:hypothetical protein